MTQKKTKTKNINIFIVNKINNKDQVVIKSKSSGDKVVSKPEILSEVENFYGKLYASHASRPDPENKDSRATLTRLKRLTRIQPKQNRGVT